jgi:hypothetical protein
MKTISANRESLRPRPEIGVADSRSRYINWKETAMRHCERTRCSLVSVGTSPLSSTSSILDGAVTPHQNHTMMCCLRCRCYLYCLTRRPKPWYHPLSLASCKVQSSICFYQQPHPFPTPNMSQNMRSNAM